MQILNSAIDHIINTAIIPSFSTFEERIHPYINNTLGAIPKVERIKVKGNNLLFRIPGNKGTKRVALAAHLDKINHFGKSYPEKLPVAMNDEYIEGAMDDCAGLGILLALAEAVQTHEFPELLLFFSEMEESKGLREHPELLKNKGRGYEHGMGAQRIAKACLDNDLIPDEVITVDTTPLFKGKPGVALYSRHWEYTDLDPSEDLIERTDEVVERLKSIDSFIYLSNNTNDYLHYGKEFNCTGDHTVVSVALEPAIYPYHQKGERVFINDLQRVLDILVRYLKSS